MSTSESVARPTDEQVFCCKADESCNKCDPPDCEPRDPDGECFRGTEAVSAWAEEQAWIQRNLK